MGSIKMLTKYETLSTGTLEWEMQDVSLYFEECDYVWESHTQVLTMRSETMQLAAGDGRQSKWHFSLRSWLHLHPRSVDIDLHFDGLVGSDGLKIDEPLHLKYNTVVAKCFLERSEIAQTFEGRERSKTRNRNICDKPIEELKSLSPHANIKISVEISHLSEKIEQLVKNNQLLGLLDFDPKDIWPMPTSSCYGNLMDNPDLSDFKIVCEGSTFHAHKFILSVQSPVFRAMIEIGLSESSQNELQIEDLTLKTVRLMLEYIYKRTLEIFPENFEDKVQLLDCAEKYQLSGLKSICMRSLLSSFTTAENVAKLAMAAFTYGANEKLSQAIKNYCIKNHEALIQNPGYKKLFLSNPQLFMN